MRNTPSWIVCTLAALVIGARGAAQEPRASQADALASKLCEQVAKQLHEINMPHVVGPQDLLRKQILEQISSKLSEELTRGGNPTQHPDGAYSHDHRDGTPRVRGHYRGGLEDGNWLTWYSTGAVQSQGAYTRGKRHGAWTTWHPNGCIESQGRYLYGRREGRWFDYHDSGVLRSDASYVNGRLDGPYRTWYVDGVKHYEGAYFHGSIHGAWQGWHENGQLAASGTYRYGKHVGLWLYFEAGGLPTEKTGFYVDGERVR